MILGGDDFTVSAEGRYSILFTRDFLTQFEIETTQVKLVEERLSMCAGITITKPHFPFHAAYDLAEELLRSSKQVKNQVKRPCSALDFHIVYDSSISDLEAIREKLKRDGSFSRLYARPYIVTPSDWIAKADADGWTRRRMWSELEARVNAMKATEGDMTTEGDDRRRVLPNSMLHDLREGLFLGHKEADARMNLVRRIFFSKGFDKLLTPDNGGSLFWTFTEDSKEIRETNYLDALDLVDFWE
jgi:hypothetical protein